MKMPSIKSVAAELAFAKRFYLGDDCPDVEVRLQVTEGGAWCLHYGDPCYDQDHRGFWGAGSLDRRTNCRDEARWLIDEAADHAAQVS